MTYTGKFFTMACLTLTLTNTSVFEKLFPPKLSSFKEIDSELIFHDEPLQSVTESLSKFFNVEFKIKSEKIRKCRITGAFSNKKLTEILRDISLILPIEWSISNNKVIIKGKGCN